MFASTRGGGASARDAEDGAADPVLAMLAAATIDDEPVTDDERHIVEGVRVDHNRETISADEVTRELAATKDWPRQAVPT